MGERGREAVHTLAEELFELVQASQGHAHCSDGDSYPTKTEFFSVVRWRLQHARRAANQMEAFLRKHGELPRPTKRTPHE